jgi:GT2 family glycosyltransferase
MDLVASDLREFPTVAVQHSVARRGARKPRKTLQVPSLSIVIVNYRQWEDTAALVRQLAFSSHLRGGKAEVVIVDNHSQPHPLAARLRRLPGVSLRRWGRNHGFARAVNEGCRLSRGQWFLLLNPDMSVSETFLDDVFALAERLAADDPKVGIVGFQLRHSDGSRQYSAGPFPSLAGTLASMAMPRYRRKYYRLSMSRRRRVPWVTGCCLLLRRECLQNLGGLDEDYFLYYEDVDLCRRARDHGWSVWFEPALRVVHHRPLHTRAVPAHLRVFTRHALLTYGAKHWAGWQARLLAGFVRLESWLRQRWAAWHGERETVDLLGQLRQIAADLYHRKPRAARRRLNQVVRQQEKRIAS